ncbi:hypothetical protein MASR2M78_07070 [Treponema sp.]
MPGFPEDIFVKAVVEAVRRNAALGFRPAYNVEWEKTSFISADSVYIRPFSYPEAGIGVAPSKAPYVMVITTPVSAYFSGSNTAASTTDRVRATKHGTGWIKAASNYVISTIAKHEANAAGFMECIFLDALEAKYLEEGSSCNIFVRLKSGELVTPTSATPYFPASPAQAPSNLPATEASRLTNAESPSRKPRIRVPNALSPEPQPV